jgi:hypothetical protein
MDDPVRSHRLKQFWRTDVCLATVTPTCLVCRIAISSRSMAGTSSSALAFQARQQNLPPNITASDHIRQKQVSELHHYRPSVKRRRPNAIWITTNADTAPTTT